LILNLFIFDYIHFFIRFATIVCDSFILHNLSEKKRKVKMIKTVKKEFDCSICEQPNIDLAVIESKNAEKEICWNCAFAQKRFNQYSKVGKEELIYS
jgi:hypothetical protein